MFIAEPIVVLLTRRSPSFRLWCVGDSHLNHRACNLPLLREDAATIQRDRRCAWVSLGDLADCIGRTDIRYDSREQLAMKRQDLFNAQVEQVVAELRRIGKKCWGMIDGNHERKILGTSHFGFTRMVADRLDATYMADCGQVPLRFVDARGEVIFNAVLELRHGGGGGGNPASVARYALRTLTQTGADIVMMGHFHRRAYVEANVSVATPLGAGVITSRRCAFVTGGYLRTVVPNVSLYAEPMCHMPSVNGMVGAQFTVAQRRGRIGVAVEPLLPAAMMRSICAKGAEGVNDAED